MMMTHSGSLQALTTEDPNLWGSSLPINRSVFGSHEFALLSEQHLNYRARLFVYTKGRERIVYPLFLRSTSDLTFAQPDQITFWDTISPEYTGPLAQTALGQDTAKDFRACFSEHCKREGILAEFVHFHPWNWVPDMVVPEDVLFDREIVFVDLTNSMDQIWKEAFSHACRKNVSRAAKEKVEVSQASLPEDIKNFYRIYVHTMDRRGAPSKYYFPLSYFMGFFKQMPENAAFFLAKYQGQVIAATLYLHDNVDMYSYLGGALDDFQSVRPTNAVVYEAIRWAKDQGKKRLILGGGYHRDDGIYRFKASFSPLRAKFHVYKHIHLPDEYHALCRTWAEHHSHNLSSNGYFPAYRSTGS